jgi:hypothetical protein
MFIIKDWAGNHIFQDRVFTSFEDGWEFLYVRFNKEADGDEDFFEDYAVFEIDSLKPRPNYLKLVK